MRLDAAPTTEGAPPMNVKLDDLDPDTKRFVLKLRAENHGLRMRLKDGGISPLPSVNQLPPQTQTMIKRLRAECSKHRIEKRAALDELAEARLKIATLVCDLADAREGIELAPSDV
jgi:hypothetical protein